MPFLTSGEQLGATDESPDAVTKSIAEVSATVTSFTCALVSSVTVSAPHLRTLPQGPRVSNRTVFLH